MKVLHIIPSVGPVRGGPSQAIIGMVKGLRDNGIEAEILATNDNGPNLLDVALGQRSEYKQVPIWFFPRFSPAVTSLREFAFSREFSLWLWHHIAEYDIVHIHALFSYPSTCAMTIARLKNIPYIVRPLGLLCQWSLEQSALKKKIYLALIERANLNHSQALHFTTEQEQQEAASLKLKPSSFVLPHGIPVPEPIVEARSRLRTYLKISSNQPVILFMSRLHPKKGLHYLIPALGKLKEQSFTFVLAGNGSPEYEAEVNGMIENAGIRDRTHQLGFVDGEMKQLLLQGSDIFALTSHSENFGIAVLDAIAAGLAIVVTPGVSLASVVEHHRLGIVTKLDIEAITEALHQSLLEVPDWPKLQARQQRSFKLIKEEYAWDKIADKLGIVYHSML